MIDLIGSYNILLLFILLWELMNKIDKPKFKSNDLYTLTVGYRGHFHKRPITVNMLVTPHLLVCGLSGQGKSRCIEYAMKDKSCILINCFEDDFKSIEAPRIIGNDNILRYLEKLVTAPCKRNKPLYIVIDEMLVLCMDKKINKCILDILAVGRHYNIFIVGIMQRGLKQDFSGKDLFNARMTFRQVDPSSYRSILSAPVGERNLNKREFYLFTDDVYFGRTYDV